MHLRPSFPPEGTGPITEVLDAFNDPSCQLIRFEEDGYQFETTIRETSTGSPDLVGVLITTALAEAADGIEQGTPILYGLSGGAVVGRCQIGFGISTFGLFASVPGKVILTSG